VHPRSTRARLQAQLGDLGEVQPYRYYTDPEHRATGWWASTRAGDIFLGSNFPAAWTEASQLRQQRVEAPRQQRVEAPR
jgi:hypothetical protein